MIGVAGGVSLALQGQWRGNTTVEPGRANDRAPDSHLDWRWLPMPTIVAHPQPSDNAPRRRRPTLHDEVDAQLPTTECVPWPGKVNREGYGPYRVTYVRHHGPVPKGMQLDHTCHSRARCDGGTTCPHRACVNPAHLEPVTPKVNFRRSLITRGFKVRSGLGWPVGSGVCR